MATTKYIDSTQHDEGRVCVACKTYKDASHFRKQPRYRGGLYSKCSPCEREDHRKKYETPDVKRRKYESAMKFLYGITLDVFDELIREQGGVCKLCKDAFDNSGRKPVVDHCHETGFVRAILCHRCNKGLGFFGDNVDGFQAAIAYLKQPLKSTITFTRDWNRGKRIPRRIFHENHGCSAGLLFGGC